MDFQAGGARYQLHAKNIYSRPNLGGFHYVNSRQGCFTYKDTGRGRNPRAVDFLQGWILMLRLVKSQTHPHKPRGVEFSYALTFEFMASNNKADYEALVAGLRIFSSEITLLNTGATSSTQAKVHFRQAPLDKQTSGKSKQKPGRRNQSKAGPRRLRIPQHEARHAREGGKLGPKWEGPYEVMEALGKGTYKIKNRNGDILPQTWNVQDLKKCYL
ncbi:hypothetical protein Tco_0246418 [Tanacetum coccineum]